MAKECLPVWTSTVFQGNHEAYTRNFHSKKNIELLRGYVTHAVANRKRTRRSKAPPFLLPLNVMLLHPFQHQLSSISQSAGHILATFFSEPRPP
jgi:hypothetical protein